MSLSEAKRLYNQGRQKLATGDWQGAVNKFKKALQFHPNYYQALLGLGDVMQNLTRSEEAIAYYNKVLAIKPNHHQSLHSRANALCGLNRNEEALASYDKAQKANPRCANGWNHWGALLCELGRYEEALNCYNRALRIKSNEYEIWFDEYEIWLQRGRVLLQLKRYEEALVSYNKAIEIKPDNFYAWYGNGTALFYLNRYEEALISYDRAIEIKFDNLDAWSSRGSALRKLGHYEEALASYSKVFELDPNYVDAWFKQGLTLHNMGHYEDAIASYDRAIEIQPEQFNAWNNRGSSFVSLDRHEEALTSFIQASKFDPQQTTAWNGQGGALLALGLYSEAQAAFEHSLSINPDDPLVWIDKGLVLHKQRFFSEAIAAYEQALKLDDHLRSALVNRGNAIWDSKGFEKALEKWDEAFQQLRPDAPRYAEVCGALYHQKGLAHYQEGRKRENCCNFWSKAASLYQMALRNFDEPELREDYLNTLQHLIKALLGLGRTEEADELLRRGADYLQRLLHETPSPGKRKLLALKFASFNQLTVDRYVQTGQLKQALKTAEEGKNACLTWLLYAWSDEITSPNYETIQQLLTPTTAIVYWHLSPAAFTTFILKPGEPAPILITTPTFQSELPKSLQRLLQFEAWMQDWDRQYQDYRNKGKKQRNTDHSWRQDMQQRLFERQEEPGNLKDILNIEAIEQHLAGITQLILIPHRDLHRFPLHALFSPNFTITYLPSAQVGISLQQRQPSSTSRLLSIENPDGTLGFARVEAEGIYQCFSQLESIQENHATKKQVEVTLNGDFSVFHFAGHAEHVPSDPRKSRLILAHQSDATSGDIKTPTSNDLTLEDLCKPDQHDFSSYHLIALSACETALTNNQSITTEYVGLVSGFLRNGAAQVVSTLWTVESAASAFVMIEFYRRRQLHKSDAAALAEAVDWLKNLTVADLKNWCDRFLAQLPADLPEERKETIERTLETDLVRWDTIESEKIYSDPYYWAAFAISGRFS
ncbi:CHAT domain-containing protein [Allocoleopsis sp.]|uniref:CHAT domain-containing protein n=1 Tax=Allocoleopsis sp. TaxID=3088169 RepID=UPI002FD23519